MHGFSDASTVGLAAAVYIRISTNASTISSLLCAKTKVARLKRQTIPRLELAASIILSRLIALVIKTLNLTDTPVYLWTDSSIVHTWVNNHSSKWKEYVHNRVITLHELVPHAQWKLVPGQDNPADCASRGLTPLELFKHPLWWNGPPWLIQSPGKWPQPQPSSFDETSLEKHTPVKINIVQKVTTSNEIITRFSSLTRLLRVPAICQRVLSRRSFRGSMTTPITPEDLEKSKYLLIQQVQNDAFENEILLLSSGKQVPRQHPLSPLTPFLDND